jgi:hypothetical protein
MDKFVARYPGIFDLFWGNVEWYSNYLRQFIDCGYCQDEREYLEIIQELGRCGIYLELQKKESNHDS